MALSDLSWEENRVARLGDELGDLQDFFSNFRSYIPSASFFYSLFPTVWLLPVMVRATSDFCYIVFLGFLK